MMSSDQAVDPSVSAKSLIKVLPPSTLQVEAVHDLTESKGIPDLLVL